MRILHYTLGLPPYRSGGLTKYSVDLMKNQVSKDQQIFLLFPGCFSLNKKTKIKQSHIYERIQVYEIINPLPVSLLGGINKPEFFMKRAVPEDVYKSFLKIIQPDIIHIHTLMGIHKEFFIAAKKLNIRLIFTSHDYFGICPKGNLLDDKGNILEDFEDDFNWVKSSKTAYSMSLIYLMHSKVYRTLKECNFVKKLRKLKKESLIHQDEERVNVDNLIDEQSITNYKLLREYYKDILYQIDYFHFNSTIAKETYQKYVNAVGEVLPISHNNIMDNRKKRNYDDKEPLKITYLGPLEKYKGFPLLKEALNLLNEKGQCNWHLNIYGNTNEVELSQIESQHVTFHGRYSQDELKGIFQNTDIIVVPSIWKETFGFIALEALSYGIPALVSEYVGFKDSIKNGENGIIFKIDKIELSKLLEQVINDRKILRMINQNICEQEFPFTMDIHCKEIQNLYERVIGVF